VKQAVPAGSDVERKRDVVRAAKALSDPVRVEMLSLIGQGRACCNLPYEDGMPDGICVCELQDQLQLGQSLVSYHLRVLKEAGLVAEVPRGRWTYYVLNPSGLEALHHFTRALLSGVLLPEAGAGPEGS